MQLPTAHAADPAAAAAAQATAVGYLGARLDQLRYADFQAAGYPIGSGAGESANKVVVEGRLKGAGMHWARAHVDPMLGLRTIEYGDRWDEDWPPIGRALRASARRRRPPAPAAATTPAAGPLPPSVPPPDPPRAAAPTRPKLVRHGRPTQAHPWKRLPCLPAGRAYLEAHPEL